MTPPRAMFDEVASLLAYPGPRTAGQAALVAADLERVNATAAAEMARFAREISARSTGELQEEYTARFDMNPASALDVGWHLFGEAHARGVFMAEIREALARVTIAESTELPDHLTYILALLAREAPDGAAVLARRVAPAIERVHRSLDDARSPYAHALAAVGALVADVAAADEPHGARL